jgi:hypothetical protein
VAGTTRAAPSVGVSGYEFIFIFIFRVLKVFITLRASTLQSGRGGLDREGLPAQRDAMEHTLEAVRLRRSDVRVILTPPFIFCMGNY